MHIVVILGFWADFVFDVGATHRKPSLNGEGGEDVGRFAKSDEQCHDAKCG